MLSTINRLTHNTKERAENVIKKFFSRIAPNLATDSRKLHMNSSTSFSKGCLDKVTIGKISVYKHCFCYSNVPTTGTKDRL